MGRPITGGGGVGAVGGFGGGVLMQAHHQHHHPICSGARGMRKSLCVCVGGWVGGWVGARSLDILSGGQNQQGRSLVTRARVES